MQRLGQLEAAVMDRIWAAKEPVTVREVLDALQQPRPLAYTTVMTVMDNLHRKGLVVRELNGRAYRYRPTRSREEHTAELMGQVLAGSGNRPATLLHFLEQIPEEERARLRAALAEHSAGDNGGPR